MSFVVQVLSGVFAGVVVWLTAYILTTGHLPKTVRAVPWWVWLAALTVAGIVIVTALIRRRNMKIARFGYIRFPDDSNG